MSKPRKIKRRKNPFGRRPQRPWKKIIAVVAVVALVFLGISLYKPIINYFKGETKPEKNIAPEPESPSTSTPVEPTKPVEQEPEPEIEQDIKAAFIDFELANNPQELDKFLANLPEEINTIALPLKNEQGQILYNTKNTDAKNWEAVVQNPLDIDKFASTLKEYNLSFAPILSTFSDPIAARGNIENAIMHSSGVIWIDNTIDRGGKPWSTPYSDSARKYNIDIAKELVEAGASDIIFDYLRFPNDPTNSAVVRATDGVSKQDILKEFISQANRAMPDTDISVLLSDDVLIDIDGAVNNSRFGGNPLEISDKIVLSKSDISLGTSYPDSVNTKLKGMQVIEMQTQNTDKLPVNRDKYIVNLSN